MSNQPHAFEQPATTPLVMLDEAVPTLEIVTGVEGIPAPPLQQAEVTGSSRESRRQQLDLTPERKQALQKIGREAIQYILDGNVRTVLGSHIVHVAVERNGGELSSREQRYLLSRTEVAASFIPKGSDGILYEPRPNSQPTPVSSAPEKYPPGGKPKSKKSRSKPAPYRA
jgi:hypothetical protein